MAKARKTAKLSETQKCTDVQTNPNVTVYEDGVTEEIVNGYLSTKLNFDFARNWGSYPLKDGRYVYEEAIGSGKNVRFRKKAYSGISPDILEFLDETDRNDTNCQRKNKDHGDYDAGSEDGVNDENDYYHPNVMDKAAFQQWRYQQTREEGVDDPIYPDELLKTDYVSGDNKANKQRNLMRRQVIKQFIGSLSTKDQATITKYFRMCMTEADIGAEEGVNKQAICNRISRMEDHLREVFRQLGIAVPTKEELKKEATEASRRRKELAKIEKERKAEEAEIRAIKAEMHKENHEGIDPETSHNIYYSGDDEFLMDYDSDNPQDSFSEAYDPYEDSCYTTVTNGEKTELWDDEDEDTDFEE